MGCLNVVFGAILPRLAILVGWTNDPAAWNAVFGSQLWLGLGFLALPWTTLIYAIVQPHGLSFLNIIFLIMAFLGDLGTWGLGIFGTRKEVSYYRGS